MATKFVINTVASINKAHAPEQLRRLGEHCVRQAFAGNVEDTQYVLDNLAQWARVPFVSWLRGRFIAIEDPALRSARYIVTGVKDQKKQNRALEDAATLPVLVEAHKLKVEKKAVTPRPKSGSVAERVNKKMERVISDLRASDPDVAAFIQDVWSRKLDEAVKDLEKELKLRLAA